MWTLMILNICVLRLIASHIFIEKDGVKVAYDLPRNRLNCGDGRHRFTVIHQTSIADCVIECALREHCAVLNYHATMTLCELYLDLDETKPTSTGQCISLLKRDIRLIQTPCNDNTVCSSGTACDRVTRKCLHKECTEIPTLEHGHVLGNMRKEGSKIRYKCDPGYKLVTTTSTETGFCIRGRWNNRADCLLEVDVGDVCNGFVCVDEHARCVAKGPNNAFCHCNFGYEFDEKLGICVKVCNQYSHDAVDFVGEPHLRLVGYRVTGSNFKTLSGCVEFCYRQFPEFLSINFVPGMVCGCKSISKRQFLKAHGGHLFTAPDITFYNRPCALAIL